MKKIMNFFPATKFGQFFFFAFFFFAFCFFVFFIAKQTDFANSFFEDNTEVTSFESTDDNTTFREATD